jgi:hypothetical protein
MQKSFVQHPVSPAGHVLKFQTFSASPTTLQNVIMTPIPSVIMKMRQNQWKNAPQIVFTSSGKAWVQKTTPGTLTYHF